MSDKLNKLWEVLDEAPTRIKLEDAMHKAGYTAEEIKDLEDGDPELARYLTGVFKDLKKAVARPRRFDRWILSDDCYHLILLRNKAAHYALDALFTQYPIKWKEVESKRELLK